jgi:hypothetical protein
MIVTAAQNTSGSPELGVIICKSCNEVIGTIPTNGTKKIYGLCGKPECTDAQKEGGEAR